MRRDDVRELRCPGSMGRLIPCALVSLALAACGGGGGGGGSGAGSGGGGAASYTIGGTVSGLSSSGLVLANGSDTLNVPSGATSFTFATKVSSGASYDVTVTSQPAGGTCTVTSGQGTATANVTSVMVACTVKTYSISGTVSGLTASGLALQYYSGGQTLAVAAGATKFAFSQPVPYGTPVKMTVVTQPYWQWCTPGASNFSGAITSNITTDTLSCAAASAHVTTFAGSTTSGSANGTGTAASFFNPAGVAVDSSGNLYIADTNNNDIRKITPQGVVTTFAGTGTAGHANGTGTAASFAAPTGVAVDGNGNVYVADSGNNEIRKITPTGVVTTLAGSTTPGDANGNGTSASFYLPHGIAVDSAGNLYVADTGNNEIRKISPSDVVSTLAGSGAQGSADGTGAAASFNNPFGVTVDAGGNLFIADTFNNEIRKVTAAGVVTTLAGSPTAGHADGIGSAASFTNPTALAIEPSGAIFVADFNNSEIREVAPGP
jgi:sugar lactone lactonase YvrE